MKFYCLDKNKDVFAFKPINWNKITFVAIIQLKSVDLRRRIVLKRFFFQMSNLLNFPGGEPPRQLLPMSPPLK